MIMINKCNFMIMIMITIMYEYDQGTTLLFTSLLNKRALSFTENVSEYNNSRFWISIKVSNEFNTLSLYVKLFTYLSGKHVPSNRRKQ